MSYGVVCADPPWDFSDGLARMRRKVKRSARSQYETMTTQELCDLRVKLSPVLNDDCVLALWVPSTLLSDGFRVMEAWGFKYKTTFVWGKTKKAEKIKKNESSQDPNELLAFGMGRLFRASHELALVGIRGNVYKSMLKDHSQRSLVLDTRRTHSCKTERLQDKLDLMFPDEEKLELFARRVRRGWTCLGKSLDGKDIRLALSELAVVPEGYWHELMQRLQEAPDAVEREDVVDPEPLI